MTLLEAAPTSHPSRVKQVGAVPVPVRADIQGLRAVAVMSVLGYHFWAQRLRGGYVGVDVFFVLSGFLITAHLLKHPTTTVHALVQFWGRRIRRLLPAATVVLLATLLASVVWLPKTMLSQVAKDAAAAALYAENWVLAGTSTDYLASADAASPLQHYWSLSVEEQFYVIWPLLIGAMFLVTRRGRRPGAALSVGLGTLFVASLSWSAYLTDADPARAYFVTPTRIWELALGGLVALMFYLDLEPTRRWTRLIASWLGLAMIGYAVMTFSSATAFPGLAALVPTVGTGLVILANGDQLPGSPRALWSNRTSQYLGGISYSIYLWHWPLIILAPFVLGRTIFWPDKVTLILMAVGLATLTKRWVEDPVRRDARLSSNLMRTFAMGAICISVVLVGDAAVAVILHKNVSASADRVVGGLRGEDCFGASATRSSSCKPAGVKLLTSPQFAKADRPDVYADNCVAMEDLTSHPVCTFGPKNATTRIALFGNSHAAQWQPPLADAADLQDWQISTYLGSGCYLADGPTSSPTPTSTKNCQDWTSWAIKDMKKGSFDLVVMSNRAVRTAGAGNADQRRRLVEAYGRILKALTSEGRPVLIIRDVPQMTRQVPKCIEAHNQDISSCTRPADNALPDDPAADAALEDKSGLVSVLDLGELLCPGDACRSVIGGVIVYFDASHLTKTFARTLAPEVTAAVRKGIR